MQAMAMTPEERREFNELKEDVYEMKKDVRGVESKIDRILSIVKGIAIGLVVGALIFGLLKFQDLVDVVK